MSKKTAPFRMHPAARAARALAVLAAVAAPGWALAQLKFSESPPTDSTGGRITTTTTTGNAKPNIIVTIDNSESMITNQDVTYGKTTYTRLAAMKLALNAAFSDPEVVGDLSKPGNEKFRLAYQAFWTDVGFGPYRRYGTSSYYGDNSMRLFDAAYQTRFKAWVNALNARDGTPAQQAMMYAGEYLRGRWLSSTSTSIWPYSNYLATIPAKDNPWKTRPGDASDTSDPLPCRRSYLIFMTDGAWSNQSLSVNDMTVDGKSYANTSERNYDNTRRVLPETLPGGSTSYEPAQWPIYFDPVASGDLGSNLADIAFFYWVNDLQPGIPNRVDPSPAQISPITTPVTYSYAGSSVTYPPDWNPKNNPATWQHMQTFTIGFGLQRNDGAGQLDGFDGFYDGNFFSQFASGKVPWPQTSGAGTGIMGASTSKLWDLVHAAYNSRGKFYQATTAEALTSAFKDILLTANSQTNITTTVTTDTTAGMASAAGSSIQLEGNMAYAASYIYNQDKADNGLGGWYGLLTSYAGSDLNGSATRPAVKWTAQIPSSSRRAFTSNPSGTGGAALPGNVSTGVSKLGQTLGDIVNSQLVYVGKSKLGSMNAGYLKFAQTVNDFRLTMGTIYVGANDGMLHAFDAGDGTPDTATDSTTGAERFAYVPLGLQSRVSAIGNDTKHHWGVDGGIFSGDAQLDRPTYVTIDYADIPANSKNWATVLVGTLGAGGKGYFALDVTKPTAISPSDTNALAKAVVVDTTDTTDANIGYQFGQPVMDQYNLTMQSAQIVKINSTADGGEWAVIMGNGYNSTNGLPVLLIQSLSKAGRPLYKVEASCTAANSDDCVKAGNGLGQPRAVDVDGNGTADIVYAGDLMGNLWKFDISNMDHTQWKVAYNKEPMFRAVGPTGAAQPITSAPVVALNTKGGFVVGFGTGKNLTDDDTKDALDSAGKALANPPLNSFYALYDTEKMSIQTKDVPDTDPVRKVSQLVLDEATVPTFCTGGVGAARYTCLNQRTSGSLNTPDDNGLSWGTTAKPASSATATGSWYFDIPETDNGNAAKVLSNPMMAPGNTVVFLADNVASSTPSGSGTPSTPSGSGGSSVQTSGDETCTTTTTTTTTTPSGSMATSALTSVNYFNLMTGAPPAGIGITLNGEKYVFDNTGNPAKGSRTGNRFRHVGTGKYVRNGSSGLRGLPSGIKFELPSGPGANSPGRRAGWRLGR